MNFNLYFKLIKTAKDTIAMETDHDGCSRYRGHRSFHPHLERMLALWQSKVDKVPSGHKMSISPRWLCYVTEMLGVLKLWNSLYQFLSSLKVYAILSCFEIKMHIFWVLNLQNPFLKFTFFICPLYYHTAIWMILWYARLKSGGLLFSWQYHLR